MAVAQSTSIPEPLTRITRNSDISLAIAVVCILGFMVIPLPTFLLDLLLTFSITFSLVILLVAMYIQRPLELSSFPSILLLTTLFRLSLNIATTRIMLLHGNEGTAAAGNIIKSFGGFVVGGNYVVGLIVFIILVVINFVVITKGAGRIAEVAARFTLDAMPGKQMSIDADLNAGFIDEQEARQAARDPLAGGRVLRGHGRRQQVRARGRRGRHHHHRDQHRGRAGDRGLPEEHALCARGPELHPADRGRRPGDPDPRPHHLHRGGHHRQPRGQRVQPRQRDHQPGLLPPARHRDGRRASCSVSR